LRLRSHEGLSPELSGDPPGSAHLSRFEIPIGLPLKFDSVEAEPEKQFLDLMAEKQAFLAL
jgi:hypothetical protein